MFIHNPKDGATIRDIWIYDKLYFSEKTQEEFKAGDVIDIDDKVGEFLLNACGFLRKVGAEKAKEIVAENAKEKFKCDKCGFETTSKIGLIGHKRTHQGAVEGVRVIRPVEEQIADLKEEEKNLQEGIEVEAKSAGLFGEGLVKENI